MKGREYEYQRVQPGTYKIVLNVNGKKFEQEAIIMQDYWYNQ
jgi:outer membrane usher protein FimD/PapC